MPRLSDIWVTFVRFVCHGLSGLENELECILFYFFLFSGWFKEPRNIL